MRRILLVATTLAVAIQLARAETPGSGTPSKKADSSASAKKSDAKPKSSATKSKASATKGAPGSSAGGAASGSKATPEAQLQVKQAKAAFMAAAASCERPGKCDGDPPSDREATSLLQTTEKSFVEACKACADEETCEKERQRIRDGSGRFGFNPCK